AQSLSAEDHEIFLEYAKNPSPFTCLVFTAYTYKLVAGSAFIKYLSEKGWVRAFNRLKDHELLAWVKREARKEGKAVSDSAAERLIELGGKNLIDIKGELEKIILFAGEKAAIDDKDVAGAGLDCKEENIFELSDAIGARNLPKALKIYGKLSYEPPVKVLGAISYQIRALLKLKSLLKNHALPSNIAGMLGIPAWKLEDYKRRSRLFTEEELKDAMQKLSSTDVGLKTGRVPQTIGLSKLIIDLCHRG
ncbi:MAG: DNA polymerase III subunit delta, partial [Deltaproteobacteria bacterium]|nr:DNA polymerase III subunit delta [Deltaproteobacteria bacterium]